MERFGIDTLQTSENGPEHLRTQHGGGSGVRRRKFGLREKMGRWGCDAAKKIIKDREIEDEPSSGGGDRLIKRGGNRSGKQPANTHGKK